MLGYRTPKSQLILKILPRNSVQSLFANGLANWKLPLKKVYMGHQFPTAVAVHKLHRARNEHALSNYGAEGGHEM